jgi:hypothetical protein
MLRPYPSMNKNCITVNTRGKRCAASCPCARPRSYGLPRIVIRTHPSPFLFVVISPFLIDFETPWRGGVCVVAVLGMVLVLVLDDKILDFRLNLFLLIFCVVIVIIMFYFS